MTLPVGVCRMSFDSESLWNIPCCYSNRNPTVGMNDKLGVFRIDTRSIYDYTGVFLAIGGHLSNEWIYWGKKEESFSGNNCRMKS